MENNWLKGGVAQTSPTLEIRVFSPRSSGGRFPVSATKIPDGLGMYTDVEVVVDIRTGTITAIRKPLQ
jgi:hypothetical protein